MIDIEEEKENEITEENAELSIEDFFKRHNLKKDDLRKRENIAKRDILLRELMARSDFSSRRIAEITGINRETVRKTLSV